MQRIIIALLLCAALTGCAGAANNAQAGETPMPAGWPCTNCHELETLPELIPVDYEGKPLLQEPTP